MGEESDQLKITPSLSIPMEELSFHFSRAGGPGGQHVNTSETRVELRFDVRSSPSLSEWQRQRILEHLKSYIDSEGVLHLFATSRRSQMQNRQKAIERLRGLLVQALRPRRPRLPTQPDARSRERRLEAKRRRSAIKRLRRLPLDES
ncbi:MAG: alternative ribosome rescue aminoacyl-tRNA hydrolase ArfB [Anaerolineae bacterium]